ncbi:hypothetical protein Syun_003509 [Stephania yunnanensis]|uniref:Uncharacterized protein n=1 Tax=Stephania yunnanensis TaxID=152371 RepID=A0AAP0PZW8_9MAGN
MVNKSSVLRALRWFRPYICGHASLRCVQRKMIMLTVSGILDGHDFVEDKVVFGEAFVIEVVSKFELPQALEEVVGEAHAGNYFLEIIVKAKVLKFATKDGVLKSSPSLLFSSKNVVKSLLILWLL